MLRCAWGDCIIVDCQWSIVSGGPALSPARRTVCPPESDMLSCHYHPAMKPMPLLCEWVQSESLRRHMLAVEASLRFLCRLLWRGRRVVGHHRSAPRSDYERFADMEDRENGHPRTELRLFRERGYPPELIHAIEAHATFLGVPRESLLDKALLACDELTGLIQACAYVRPDRDLRNARFRSRSRRSGRTKPSPPLSIATKTWSSSRNWACPLTSMYSARSRPVQGSRA